ncbi:cytochrome P450 [Actinomadura scrupuli]|uniref:cytochrome P450 n=1 Tax=Actinomadura scrupuli TaxID=559629 RepID=UPI003D96968E
MADFDTVDFFTDPDLIPDPYPYFDHLRERSPVLHQEHLGVYSVSGHQEALATYRDEETYSSCVSVIGPLAPLPFEVAGDDINELIRQHRDEIAMAEFVVTQDPPVHSQTRGLLNRLLKPKRLKENEDYMWQLADQRLDEFIAKGGCEFMEDYAKPFSGLVIAELLGVPEEDRTTFRDIMGEQLVGGLNDELAHNPLEWLDEKFTTYIADRRENPRVDVLTDLAQATYPDGTVPEIADIVRLATFLFAAGQETTTKLLSTGMRVLAERPDLQTLLREDNSKIPNFLEECLRTESPVKSHFRLVRKNTELGDVSLPAGGMVMLLPGACNRDPKKFENPHEFQADRGNVREHIAFGRGIHSCPGAPLARSEGRISMTRILARMTDIAIDESVHGPADNRNYTYDPTFIMRGLSNLAVTFTPVK